MTLNAVTILMNNKVKDWKRMRKVMASRLFIPSILKLDTSEIEEKTRKMIVKEFMSNEDFTFERVNKKSKVAGPLVLWVKAQLKFAELLDYLEPMIKEVRELEAKLEEKEERVEQLKEMLVSSTLDNKNEKKH